MSSSAASGIRTSAVCTDWTAPVSQSCDVAEHTSTITACGAPRMRLRTARAAAGSSATSVIAPSTTSTTTPVDMIGARYPVASCVGDNQRRVNGAASSGHERRPRPVADAPIDGLLERADELAKRWALALVAARPLEAIGRLPLTEIAAMAPSLCASVLRAPRSRANEAIRLEEPPGVQAAVRHEPAHEARSSARESAVAPLRATVAGGSAPRSRAVLVDEFGEPPTGARGSAGVGWGRPTHAASASARAEEETAQDARPLPWDIPLGGPDTEFAREVSKRRKADIPSISIVRRRRPRERE